MKKDILILGGGPAGLSAALHLHQLAPHLAPRVLILEKETYPRPKLCGGGLMFDGEILLQRLGLDLGEIAHTDVKTALLHFGSGGLSFTRPGKTPTLRVIRREELDAWLAGKVRQAGMEILEQTPVSRIQRQGEEWEVEAGGKIFRAQAIIAADGANSIARRSLFPRAPLYTARLLEGYLPAPARPPRPLRHAYFQFSPIPQGIAGYVWDFPTPGGERCCGIYDTNLLANQARPALKTTLQKEMQQSGYTCPPPGGWKSHPIRYFAPHNPFSAPGVLLAGDAAGIDPIFGEGISFSLGYGKMAALAVKQAFASGDFSFSRYRWQILFSSMGQALVMRWFIAQFLYQLPWAWLQWLFWRVLKPFVALTAWLFVLNWGRRL
jgi:flavin-dependent dehydrogenase